MITYAQLLKAIRNCTGETQRQLAERWGVSLRTLQGWEAGRQPGGVVHLRIIGWDVHEFNLSAGGSLPPSLPTPRAKRPPADTTTEEK